MPEDRDTPTNTDSGSGVTARLERYFNDTLWRTDADALHPAGRLALRSARTAAVVVRDLADGQLTLRAMSLVYTTLLSLVPLLAVSFSVLKAFGAHNQIEPFLLNFLLPLGERGEEITQRIIEFVENTRVGVLGGVGMAFLIYTVVALIQKIERTFNLSWHVRNDRPLARRFSDYLSVVLIGPVLVFSAMGITASLTSTTAVQYLSGIEPFGTLIGLMGRLIPYLLVTTAFTLIYVLVPNTRVRFGPALAGALVAALLWVTLGWAFAAFVAGSAKYTAIYSAFATLVFFMIWLYLSWLILLIGASVAFYVQHPEFVGRERGTPTLSARARERFTLLVMHQVAEAFFAGREPPSAAAVAGALGVPQGVVKEALLTLRDTGLVRADGSEPHGWLPARPLERIGVDEVVRAARGAGADSRLEGALERAPAPMGELFRRLEETRADTLAGHTVRDWMEA